MGTDYLKNSNNYQAELEAAKSTLIQLNDNIRKIVGRRSDKFRTVHEGKKSDPDRIIQKVSLHRKRNIDNGKPSVFNRLSAAPPRLTRNDNEDARPMRLNSRVIREMPSRQEVVAAQGADSASRDRSRRIFGSLVGTLQKFCQEESRLKDKEQKKANIEKRVEEQELRERIAMKRERETLFEDRKRKQAEVRALEMKMNRVKEYEVWESSAKHLTNFIRTKAKPHIYYKPRAMCKKLLKLQAETKSVLTEEIERKRQMLNQELSEIENNIKMDVNYGMDDQMENMERITVYAEHKDDSSSYHNKQQRSSIKRRVTHTTHNDHHDNNSHNNGNLTANIKVEAPEPSLSSRVVVVSSSLKAPDSS